MATVNELNISNFMNTGQTTPMARYTFTVEIKWVDDENVAHTYGPQTHTFPNDLSVMPLNVRRAFAERMIDATARVSIGAASWEQFL